MATFSKTYSETVPQGSALANTLDTVIQEDKVAINERFKLEHNAFDASGTGQDDSDSANAQGRHLPGRVACTYIGTTAQIAALTGMVSGSLAYDTDLGILKIYNGTNWTTYSVSGVPISGTELFVSIFGSAALAAAGATSFGTWSTAPANIANLFDKSNATDWDDAVIAASQSAGYYWDLSDEYQGHILAQGNIKTTNSTILFVSVPRETPTTNNMSATWRDFSCSSATYQKFSILMPFYGRYPAIMFTQGGAGTGTIQLERLELYGVAI